MPENFTEKQATKFIFEGLQFTQTLDESVAKIRDRANKKTEKGNTLLHIVARSTDLMNSYAITESLLNVKADPRAKDEQGLTPVQVAVMYDNAGLVKLYHEYDETLITKDLANNMNLVHFAAFKTSYLSLAEILDLNPKSVDLRVDIPGSIAHGASTIFMALFRLIVDRDVQDVHKRENRLDNEHEYQIGREAAKAVDILIEKSSHDSLFMQDRGSVVHDLIQINYFDGLVKLFGKFANNSYYTAKLLNHENSHGKTPLVSALTWNFGALKAAHHLLSLNADASVKFQEKGLAKIVVERGGGTPDKIAAILDDILEHGADLQEAIAAVRITRSIQLMKIVIRHAHRKHLPVSEVVNFQSPPGVGKASLHFLLEDNENEKKGSARNIKDDITFLLNNGANPMLAYQETMDNDSDRLSYLPIHVATRVQSAGDHSPSTVTASFGKTRIKDYLEAMLDFGLDRILNNNGSNSLGVDRAAFVEAHLIPGVYSVCPEFVIALLSEWSKLSEESQYDLIHYKLPADTRYQDLHVYQNSALFWATDHKHQPLMGSIVRAEFTSHKDDKDKGLKCFADLPTTHLKEQATKLYLEHFGVTNSKINSVLSAFFFVVFICFISFGLDMWLDVNIIKSYEKEGLPKARETSIYLIVPSLAAYVIVTWAYVSIPRRLLNWIPDSQNPCLKLVKLVWRVILWLFMPVIYLWLYPYRYFKMDSEPEDVGCRKRYNALKDIWTIVRRVEIGIEGTGQLILQLWLFSPHLGEINKWDGTSTFGHIWSGFGFIFSGGTIAAGFLDIMLAKFLLSTFVTCATTTFMRVGKNTSSGLSPIAMLVFFVSNCFQAASRYLTLTLVFITVGQTNVVAKISFVAVHFVCNLIIKLVFEWPPKTGKQDLKTVISIMGNIFTGACASLLLYMNVNQTRVAEELKDNNVKNTLFPVTAHFLLNLIIHMVILIWSYVDPPEGFSELHDNLYRYLPLLFLLVGAGTMAFYYRKIHPGSLTMSTGPRVNKEWTEAEVTALICCQLRPMVCRLPSCCRCCRPSRSSPSSRPLLVSASTSLAPEANGQVCRVEMERLTTTTEDTESDSRNDQSI